MKAIILALVVAIVMAVALSFRSSDTVTYIKESVTPEVVAPIVKEAWMTDEDAIQAAKDVIKKKELEAELASLDAEIKEKQARRKVVTDELTTY
jgi:cell shape-determining protein MreC